MEGITWFGHASFSFLDLESENRIYYVDPFHMPEDSETGSIDKADIIFVTHAHPDHLSPPDISRLLKDNTVVVATKDSLDTLKIKNKKISVAPYNQYEVAGFEFKTVPAYNLNPERPHKKEYGWVGYIFTVNGVKIYHAGDTDFIPEMRDLADENLDIAMIPMGGMYVMTPEEAVQAANAIKAKKTIPMHYKGLLKEKTKEGEEIFKKGVTESEVLIMEEFK